MGCPLPVIPLPGPQVAASRPPAPPCFQAPGVQPPHPHRHHPHRHHPHRHHQREDPLSGTSHQAGLPFREALQLTLAALILFLVLRPLLAGWGLPGLAVVEWVALVFFPVGLLTMMGRRVSDAVPLARLPLGGVAATLLLGVGALPLAWSAFWIVTLVAPVDPDVLESFGRELLPEPGDPVLPLFFLAAVTPAVCEEFVFRGILLRGLLARFGAAVSVTLSAAAFGILHWSPGAAVRMAPTLVLGLLLGWAVWRTRSLWSAVLIHLCYNAFILAAALAAGGAEEELVEAARESSPGAPPLAFLLLGLAFVLAGAHFLVPASTPRSSTLDP